MSVSLADLLDRSTEAAGERIYTALPGVIVSPGYDATTRTVAVSPSIARADSELPPVVIFDCPVLFPGTAQAGVTFPLAVGDPGLLVFSMRSIDGWAKSGHGAPNTDYRRHDINDPIFIPGLFSASDAPALATDAVNLVVKFGNASVSISPLNTVTIQASGTEIYCVTAGLLQTLITLLDALNIAPVVIQASGDWQPAAKAAIVAARATLALIKGGA